MNCRGTGTGTLVEIEQAHNYFLPFLRENGEAIFETTPWLVFGEGPTQPGQGGPFSEKGEVTYSGADVRYTSKGCRFYEGAVRVPLVISWPGHFEQRVVADGLAELTDLAPTLAEVAGVPLPWSYGRSLVPMLTR